MLLCGSGRLLSFKVGGFERMSPGYQCWEGSWVWFLNNGVPAEGPHHSSLSNGVQCKKWTVKPILGSLMYFWSPKLTVQAESERWKSVIESEWILVNLNAEVLSSY